MSIAQGNALDHVGQWGKRPERAKVLYFLAEGLRLLKLCQATTMPAQFILIKNSIRSKSDTSIVGRTSAEAGAKFDANTISSSVLHRLIIVLLCDQLICLNSVESFLVDGQVGQQFGVEKD